MRIIVLSALGRAGEAGRAVVAGLEAAARDGGHACTSFEVAGMDVRPCLGCGACGARRPGRCVHDDAFAQAFARIPTCDLLVFAAPVRFGAWHPALKVGIDRFMPLLVGFYERRQGELHHQPRYERPTRLLGVALQSAPSEEEAATVRLLVERHRRNFAMSSQAAIVSHDPAAALAQLAPALAALEVA